MRVLLVLAFLAAIAIVGAGAIGGRLVTQQESAAKTEVRLQELRTTNPQAYLAELQTVGDTRWQAELRVLDKPRYDILVAQLKEELRNTSPADLPKLLGIYDRLLLFEPTEYTNKRDGVLQKLRAREAKEKDQLTHPERYVIIEGFSWKKGGFGTTMQANFSLKNSLPWKVKDIEIRCKHSAPSGTMIDENSRTIYESIEPNKTRQISDFGMGFIHTQAHTSLCEVKNAVVLR